MKIIHALETEVSTQTNTLSSFLVTNKKGGFYLGSIGPTTTKFNGLYAMHGDQLRRCVESISAFDSYDAVINNGSSVTLKNGKSQETFFLNHSNTLVYEVSGTTNPVKLILDCRNVYDFSDVGRIYSIKKSRGCTVIEYTKYAQSDLSTKQYSFFLAVKTNMSLNSISSWVSRNYSADASRNSSADFFVYDAFRAIPATGKNTLVVAYAESEKEAISQANHIFENITYIKRLKKRYANSVINTTLALDTNTKAAYQNALLSFDNLIHETSFGVGIFAGLPWFAQFWARDEAISTIALLYEEQYDLMKSVLTKWLVGEGRIPNRQPFSELGSADATGWVYFRLHQLISVLKSKKLLVNYFTTEELFSLYTFCLNKLNSIESSFMKYGLIHNGPLETWMDTTINTNTRDGFRIEIQALHIASYNLLLSLSELLQIDSKDLVIKKQAMIQTIRSQFYNGSYLFDGISDPTIRPNVFIAAYVAPEILSKDEWKLCLRKTLSALFVPSGLATIDVHDPSFKEFYTGENNASYHRGDVWFWLNGLAGVVLHRFGKTEFKKEIRELAELFSDELLRSGTLGTISEVSSAMQHTSSGCYSQAWSLATYIEFINTLNSSVNQKSI